MPDVDVLLDGQLAAENLFYRGSTAWADFGSFVYPADCAAASLAAPLLEKRITLKPNQAADLVILNAAEHLRVTQVDEDLAPTPTNGTRYTFVNAAVGTTDVAIETFGGPLPGLSPIAFGNASKAILQNAGTAALNFHTTDKDDPRQIVSLDAPGPPGTYTIMITGYPNTEPLVLDSEVAADQTYIGTAASWRWARAGRSRL
jgi:hypothetical protein